MAKAKAKRAPARTRMPRRDWIAMVLIGAGSSYARGADPDDCVKRVLRILKSDWGRVYQIESGTRVVVNLIEVTGHDHVSWDTRGFYDCKTKESLKGVKKVETFIP